MKAAQIKSYGDARVIEINNDAPQPTAQAGEVIVEVHAASLNRIDTSVRAGYLAKMMPAQFPVTLGGDFAGVVSEIGEGVTTVKVGDEVYGNGSTFKGGSGSLAEFVAVKADNVGLKPTKLDFTQAAAVPLVGASALQAVEEHLKVQRDQKVLIHGGAGGIGSIAIQLAKLEGAYVITTAAKDEAKTLKELGADEIIDYTSQDFSTLVKDLDAVFDTVGGDVTNKSLGVIRKGGLLVSMAGQPDQDLAQKHGVVAFTQMTTVSTEQLKELAELIDSDKIKIHVDKTFPLSQVKEAFEYFEANKPKGKIVVEVK